MNPKQRTLDHIFSFSTQASGVDSVVTRRPSPRCSPLSTVFSVWMLSPMWRVGKRRMKGFHMIPNEPGDAWDALRYRAKRRVPCAIANNHLTSLSQQLLATNTTEKKRRSKKGHRTRTTSTDQTRFSTNNNNASKHVLLTCETHCHRLTFISPWHKG